MDTIWSIIGFGIFAALYLLPTIVAWSRHHQTAMVAVLNVFLGWTIIGWIISLAIAFGDRSKRRGVTVGS
jgi:hypothetical protein